MARTRTLAQLVARVRYQADVEGLTSRHPDSDIRQLINDSWQTLRELVTEHGSPLFLKATSGTMTAGAIVPDASGAPNLEAGFGTINLPADCLRVHGVDVEVNGQLLPLEPLPFNSRDDWQDWWGNNRTDAPFGFVVYDIGQESTTTVAAGKIALLPAPDEPYSYTIWYLPHWVDISTDSHVFNVYAGWEQWLIWDVVIKIAGRDNDSRNTYQIAMTERQRNQDRLLASARVQRSGVRTVQDSRGRKRWTRIRSQRWEGA